VSEVDAGRAMTDALSRIWLPRGAEWLRVGESCREKA
jgi:hypothetical protein